MAKYNKHNKNKQNKNKASLKTWVFIGVVILSFVMGFVTGVSPFAKAFGVAAISGTTFNELQLKLSQLDNLETQNKEMTSQITQLEQEKISLRKSIIDLINSLFQEETPIQETTTYTSSGGGNGGSSDNGGSASYNPMTIVPVEPIQIEPPVIVEPVELPIGP